MKSTSVRKQSCRHKNMAPFSKHAFMAGIKATNFASNNDILQKFTRLLNVTACRMKVILINFHKLGNRTLRRILATPMAAVGETKSNIPWN